MNKNRLLRNCVVMGAVTVIMSVLLSLYIAYAGSVPAADAAVTYADGTYTASARGCLSDVSVTVTIIGGKVAGVDIDASGETPDLGGKAAEQLASALAKTGDTSGVDAVSGSTMTSEAVFSAMDSCLEQAAQ